MGPSTAKLPRFISWKPDLKARKPARRICIPSIRPDRALSKASSATASPPIDTSDSGVGNPIMVPSFVRNVNGLTKNIIFCSIKWKCTLRCLLFQLQQLYTTKSFSSYYTTQKTARFWGRIIKWWASHFDYFVSKSKLLNWCYLWVFSGAWGEESSFRTSFNPFLYSVQAVQHGINFDLNKQENIGLYLNLSSLTVR